MARSPRHPSTAFFSINGEALYLNFPVNLGENLKTELDFDLGWETVNLGENLKTELDFCFGWETEI
ncbi:MAG: hypothetical protein F6K22_15740 [Okeania sp. SIO2F4]|uniref:hypothetical protein n=1 Tax=Okeania sp. SIO2F4 TaxID=2607790 RepID=UPI00142CF7A0|nr:hypothetical protein [Okeania sp. SIO2F4]NES04158.1 hypothetical protein [Okeania sp. SIO2F4]